MTQRPGVTVVGSLHYDVMLRAPHLPRMGETLVGDAWWWKPGGKGGNQAMAAARHGADTRMVGRVGDDAFGLRLRESLDAAGVDSAYVRTVEEASGMSVAIEESGGDYAAIVVSGANLDIDPTQIEASAAIIEASAVLLLQNEISEPACLAAASIARAAGATVLLNAAPARPLAGLRGLVDVLVVNAIEAEMLGTPAVTDLASAHAAAKQLTSLADIAIVTAGSAGFAAVTAQRSWAIEAQAVDSARTHGAGDVFVGALAARLADGEDLEACLRYANAAAGMHVGSTEEQRPAIGPDEVRRMLADSVG